MCATYIVHEQQSKREEEEVATVRGRASWNLSDCDDPGLIYYVF